ncbi:DUF4333 domain-containing protein [Nocardioides sp. IC4_145]|uniref:DUF4333 domain-containing protein n=1 Tax=Nocardioides sp. IC4_145 TaxID=2714037 RepID=UPI00140B1782|nr:DUF4333 domain-containing protein [Nocardioides sp. IC4_145]NHC22885.1 DUF4333 domain-containing protein [Nocardioides sp. IC4_145]
MRRPLLRAAGLAPALLLVACGGTTTGDLSADALAAEVAALYPAAGDARVDVRCAGPLAGELGATQDCRVAVRRDVVTVRATVTEESDEGPMFETVPVVAAGRVARTVLRALVADEYVVGEVACEAELVGVVGESVACRAAPPDGGRRAGVTATVHRVEGLDVRIRYRLVG